MLGLPQEENLGLNSPSHLLQVKKKKYVSLVSCMYIFAFFFLFFWGEIVDTLSWLLSSIIVCLEN